MNLSTARANLASAVLTAQVYGSAPQSHLDPLATKSSQPLGSGTAAGPAQGAFTAQRFIDDALQNPYNRAILERLPALQLPDAWLVAGCLFQTVWNLHGGRAPTEGIKDYDLFYFDGDDLSPAAERAVQQRVHACYQDLGITIEAKNQARVHTWYAEWFGFPYPALRNCRDGIDRFLVPCTSVGLQNGPPGEPPTLYAPYGLADLYDGILRPNPLSDHRPLFRQKALSYQQRWDWLRVEEAP